MGAVTVAATSGAASDGLAITGGSLATFSFSSATIGTTASTIGGHGIELDGQRPVTFTTVDIDGTAGSAIFVQNNSNTVNVNGGNIGVTADTGNASNPALDVAGGNAAINIAANLTNTANIGVQVTGRTGGRSTSPARPAVTTANIAVNLTNNTGATINFIPPATGSTSRPPAAPASTPPAAAR